MCCAAWCSEFAGSFERSFRSIQAQAFEHLALHHADKWIGAACSFEKIGAMGYDAVALRKVQLRAQAPGQPGDAIGELSIGQQRLLAERDGAPVRQLPSASRE